MKRNLKGLIKWAQNTTNTTERVAYPGALNNPGNMRFYNVGWLGEQPTGIARGQFTRFDTPQHGLRAAARNAMNIGARQPQFTIDSFVPIYSPGTENNTDRHAQNISDVSGIARDTVLDSDDTGQMVDFLRGLIQAESGANTASWFTPTEYTNAVTSARTSR